MVIKKYGKPDNSDFSSPDRTWPDNYIDGIKKHFNDFELIKILKFLW